MDTFGLTDSIWSSYERHLSFDIFEQDTRIY